MNRLFLLLAVFLFAPVSAFSLPATEAISLNLPKTVISEAVTAILPVDIDARSSMLQGDITIVKMEDLQIEESALACKLTLAGRNMVLATELAGHQIRLKVGTLDMEFKTRATVSYNAKKQVLLLKPQVQEVAVTRKGESADIGQAMAALLDGREFAIALDELDPIIARTGSKVVTINTRIDSIKAQPGAISLSLLPQISAEPQKP